MNFYELLSKNTLVNQIPLVFNGIKLPAETAANVVILKVSFNNAIENLKKEQEEILKNLKKEGFDDRLRSVEEMYSVEERAKKCEEWVEGSLDSEGKEIPKPEAPSESELAKAKETRSTLEDFNKEQQELFEVYEKALQKKYLEEVELDKGISKEDWKNIYDIIGVDATIDYRYPNGTNKEISGMQFMQYVGELIK